MKVLVRDDKMVQDYEAMDQGVRRYIGRRYAEVSPGTMGFVPVLELVEVPDRKEYVDAVRDGDLYAGDEATAKRCGVEFSSAPLKELEKARKAAAKDSTPADAPADQKGG